MHNGPVGQVATKLVRSGRFRQLLWLLIMAVVILGVLMAPIEKGAVGAKILNEGDGLWFAVTTVTGVGYGDMVPVTSLGKVAASFLEIFGVVLFGSVVAFVAVELLRYQEDFHLKRILGRLDEQDRKMEEIKKEIGYLVKK